MQTVRKQNSDKKSPVQKASVSAFPYTIPIMAGFLFSGLAHDIYMHVSGFHFLYPANKPAAVRRLSRISFSAHPFGAL